MPAALLHGNPRTVAARFEEAGLSVLYGRAPSLAYHLSLVTQQRVEASDDVAVVTDRCGWHGLRYLYPDGEPIGTGVPPRLRDPAAASSAFAARGTHEAWRDEVGALAVGNPAIVLAICNALSGPVLSLAHQRSGGWHAAGEGGTGKSTLSKVAASVWGRPADLVGSWNTTAVGPEQVMEARARDGLAIFDDTSNAQNRRDVHRAIYTLTDGGRIRAERDGSSQRRRQWQAALWSTGEHRLEEFIDDEMMEGAKNRLTSVQLDGRKFGCFDDLHDAPDGAAFARHLDAATRQHHGTLARLFIAELARWRREDEARLRADLQRRIEAFRAKHLPRGPLAEAVTLVAERAGLDAACGELAIEWGLLPWPRGEAERGMAEVFGRWRDARGDLAVTSERLRAVRHVARWCESERARFVRYEDAGASKGSAARQAPGYWWKEPDGAVSLLIPRDRWRSICKGMDPVAVAKALHKQGLLLRPVSGTSFLWHLSARWLPGAPKPPKIPYYKLKMEIFDRA